MARSETDCAVFVLTPDDLRIQDGPPARVARDNVLFELGLFMGALGRGRTFGVKCSHCVLDLPTDLHGVTWIEFPYPHEPDELSRPVDFLDQIALRLTGAADQIVEHTSSAVMEPVRAAGSPELIQSYPMRGVVTRHKWNSMIRGTHRHLWLYGMAELGYAEDDSVPGIIAQAAADRSDIRVLLLSPDYAAIGTIESEEGNPLGTLIARIRAALSRFSGMQSRYGTQLQLRTYCSSPTVSIVRGDDHMLMTPYVRFLAGSNSPTFELQKIDQDGMFERYVRHFENVWESAEPWRV